MSDHSRTEHESRKTKSSILRVPPRKRKGTDGRAQTEGFADVRLAALRKRVRQKGYPSLDVLRVICERAKERADTANKKNVEGRIFNHRGFYIKHLRPSENYRMYWQLPEKGDVDHVTLGTKDRHEAEDLVMSFVFSLGYNDSPLASDPNVSVVISRFIDTLRNDESGQTRKSSLTRLKSIINEEYPGVTMSQLSPNMQHEIIKKMAPKWGVHAARNCMVAFATAVRSACTKDGDNNIFSLERPVIILNRGIICDLLDLDDPEPQNWHPDPETMALVLREVSNNEPVRRWMFLALYTAMRPSHIFELNSRMIRTNFGSHVFDARRRRVTATDKNAATMGFFRNTAANIKRRPQLPFPLMIYDEMSSWGDDQWITISYEAVRTEIARIATKLNQPLLIPSSFRDFCNSLIECSSPHIGGPDVPRIQAELWLGHRVTSEVHAGYGRFHQGFLRDAAEAVVLYMKWLDRESGGVLFRQVSAKSASEEDGILGDGIRAVQLTTAMLQAMPPELRQDMEDPKKRLKYRQMLASNEMENGGSEAHWEAVRHELENGSRRAKTDTPKINIGDQFRREPIGETTDLVGQKLLETGLIRGFEGDFRRVTDGRVCEIWAGDYPRVGSKYVLPTIGAWFRAAGIEIFDTDLHSVETPQRRLFVEKISGKIISLSDVQARMGTSLGQIPKGWENHSDDLGANGGANKAVKLEYRDPSEPSDFPRGLLELVGSETPLGHIEGVPVWFKEITLGDPQPLIRGERADWRYVLRNLQVFFDLNTIRIFDAGVNIGGRTIYMRFFADMYSEKLVDQSIVRNIMISEIGCDPGGWADHSSVTVMSDFDVEHFIATTPLAADLDGSAESLVDGEWEPVLAWC
ncbi:hypothetical protein FV222_02240 [Methylobacterium sp. WL103]|uniref:hypothetical protein n=1 Tax=Methylobacterium sp. WL103 TaxID=2603891 RepID=UPI0011CC54C1|nr:hypothetical protein [Methylobacterium sp. WL103]TXN07503.1 hypothetical protein FV222_02240 [Methylobacterium sp. WL103]